MSLCPGLPGLRYRGWAAQAADDAGDRRGGPLRRLKDAGRCHQVADRHRRGRSCGAGGLTTLTGAAAEVGGRGGVAARTALAAGRGGARGGGGIAA